VGDDDTESLLLFNACFPRHRHPLPLLPLLLPPCRASAPATPATARPLAGTCPLATL
jgi:hypothetical protein